MREIYTITLLTEKIRQLAFILEGLGFDASETLDNMRDIENSFD